MTDPDTIETILDAIASRKNEQLKLAHDAHQKMCEMHQKGDHHEAGRLSIAREHHNYTAHQLSMLLTQCQSIADEVMQS